MSRRRVVPEDYFIIDQILSELLQPVSAIHAIDRLCPILSVIHATGFPWLKYNYEGNLT